MKLEKSNPSMMSSVMTQGHLFFQVSCFALFNTPLHNYMCIKIYLIYPGLRFTDISIPSHIYMEACTEIPFAFVVISQTPSIFLPNQLWFFISGFATFSFSCLERKIPLYFTPVKIRIGIKK